MRTSIGISVGGLMMLLSVMSDAATGPRRPVDLAAAPPAPGSGLPNVADLNGDGYTDLVVANGIAGNVSVFFGSAEGFPATPVLVDYSARTYDDVVLGDFDEDGVTDMVVDQAPQFLTFFQGLGDGNFSHPMSTNAMKKILATATGRFRGPLQAVGLAFVGKAKGGKAAVMVINGHPWGGGSWQGFDSVTYVEIGTGPSTSVAVGDLGTAPLNGTPDGYPDLAVTLPREKTIAVLYNDGTGKFPLVEKFSASRGMALAIRDFDGDTCLDVVEVAPARGIIAVHLGNCLSSGQPTLAAPIIVARFAGTGVRPLAPTALDLNGDAKPDLAVTTAGSRVKRGVALLVNTTPLPGAPQFDAPLLCRTGGLPRGIAAGHYDLDIIEDLAVANRRGDVKILYLDGTGTSCPTPLGIGSQ